VEKLVNVISEGYRACELPLYHKRNSKTQPRLSDRYVVMIVENDLGYLEALRGG